MSGMRRKELYNVYDCLNCGYDSEDGIEVGPVTICEYCGAAVLEGEGCWF
jgi:DNA-directed RNA polymerase subunit RPC12/RpoP